MKVKHSLIAGLAITALAGAAMPGSAAASTAGTTIVNVARVDYKDASNTNSFSAAFSTTVTVNLVKAGLNVTSAPSEAAMPGFNCVGLGSFASGGTFSAVYALTTTANGQDTYKLSISNSANNASSSTATYSLLKADGTVLASAPGTRILNSAIVVGTSDSDTLLFPGGSLKNAASNGFATGDIVVVEYADSKTAYLVKNVTLGNAEGYSISGSTPSTVTGNRTDEVQDRIQVEPYSNNSLGIGAGGAVPNFAVTAPKVGSVVGQMALVKIDVSAVSSVKDLDATVDYKLTVTDSADDNVQYVGSAGNTPANTCPAGNFLATKLEILKQVRNWTKNNAALFSASATGDPGDVLEYQITVTNNGGQANAAAIIDTIPPYTKLVTFATGYGNGAANDTTGFFAQLSDGTNSVDLTLDANGEVAAQPAGNAPNVGFGKAAGVTPTSALNFYLGHGSSSSAGGTVPSCSDSTKNSQELCVGGATWRNSYTVKYRVKVD